MSKDRSIFPLVYSCSGCSSAAQMANHIALEHDRREVAEMSCIAGVGADVPSLVKLDFGAPGRRGRRLATAMCTQLPVQAWCPADSALAAGGGRRGRPALTSATDHAREPN